MSKHYLKSGHLDGVTIGGTLPVYLSEDGGECALSPAGIKGLSRLVELKVKRDSGGRYVEPPVSDEQIESAARAILK